MVYGVAGLVFQKKFKKIKNHLVWWVQISAATFRCEDHESMDPSRHVSTVQEVV